LSREDRQWSSASLMEQLTPRVLQWPSGRMPIATRGTFYDDAVDSDFLVKQLLFCKSWIGFTG
ncbi:MAG: hypothetical protein ACK5ZC_08665, partial [Pirellulaceae bacterium]